MCNINIGQNKKVQGLKIWFSIAKCVKYSQRFVAAFGKKHAKSHY